MIKALIKIIPFYQKDLSFFDSIFEVHLPYFSRKEISSFEIVLYQALNVHIESWLITSQTKAEMVGKELFKVKRIGQLGNRITIPISSDKLRIVYVYHYPAPRMGSGKETWSLIEGKWTCLESKGTWIG